MFDMLPFVLFIVGLLTMCVPEDAGLLRFVVQGGIGLILFELGVALANEYDRQEY
jgi:hypothetical protein